MSSGKRTNAIATVAGLVATMIAATDAAAEPERFTNRAVAVADATQFIEDAQNGQYRYGQSLTMTVRRGAEANRLAGLKLQARIFPLDEHDSLPRPWASFDPCDVYYTFVIPVSRISDRGTINLGPLNQLGWLLLADGRVVSGRFKIVFEARSDNHAVFRLDRTRRDAYFKRALDIEVQPPTNNHGSRDDVPSEQSLRDEQASILAIARQNDPKWICYRFEAADAGQGLAGEVAGLRRCTDKAPT